jgi:hypothetical protein
MAASFTDSRHACEMVSLSLEAAVSVLVLATSLMAVQLVIVTLELVRLRRDVLRALEQVQRPSIVWSWEDEPTQPRTFRRVPAVGGRQRPLWVRVRVLLRWLCESIRGLGR